MKVIPTLAILTLVLAVLTLVATCHHRLAPCQAAALFYGMLATTELAYLAAAAV
ncbi:hypothetical protein [Methylobacterium brachythecii]|uniref:Uncharacterized protein n=1 Tax=Methylobacterium brachythecii TaxID=1176177 RepID=A0A7W6AGY9_9HYPH|nr:hypothetical protein [Methylobacterium brachythecii]MBB3901034.1 hypothetical protein [Methylobacterium brachythecii]GLS45335.1 hypothetical protein GCM10007884_33240 [Methylobacterium brachythecii]